MEKARSLFHDSDFMKFWVGQSISVLGAQFSPFAIQTIGVMTVLGSLPFLFVLFSPVRHVRDFPTD